MDDFPSKLGIPDWEMRLIPGRTKVDYDRGKEQANREKHGYSLESAVHLFEREIMSMGARAAPRLITSDGFLEGGEVRHTHISVDDSGNVVLMVTTMRPDETVRIISYRPASAKERDCYCQMTGYR